MHYYFKYTKLRSQLEAHNVKGLLRITGGVDISDIVLGL